MDMISNFKRTISEAILIGILDKIVKKYVKGRYVLSGCLVAHMLRLRLISPSYSHGYWSVSWKLLNELQNKLENRECNFIWLH